MSMKNMNILLLAGVVNILMLYGDAVNPRSINFNLDTSFLLENDDGENMPLMDKINNFLEKIKNFLQEHLNLKEDESFLKKFFKKIFELVLKFNNGDLQDIAKTTADEITKMIEENNEFSDADFKKTIKGKIKVLLGWKAKQIRAKIRKTLDTKSEKLKRYEDKFLEFYDDNDKSKIKRIINRIDESPESLRKVKKIIKDSFNVFFYEKYDGLNKSQRSLFVKEVRKLLTHIDLDSRRINEYIDHSSASYEDNSNNRVNSSENNTIIVRKDFEININRQKSDEVEN